MKRLFYFIPLLLIFASCGSYRQNIMFQTETSQNIQSVSEEYQTPRNYVVQPNDLLELNVYTKKGEFLIDPENRLIDRQIPNNANFKPDLKYLVQKDGSVVLPMVGTIELSGLTLFEAEQKLIKAYETYYKDPFVKLRYINKRVIVLGAAGGTVIPLENESTTVVEILALAQGFDQEAKSHNIRLLRGDEAFLLDFSTIEGYRNDNMIVESGDVIYVEPVRRPFTEFLRDNGPVISVLSSVVSLIVVIISLN